MVGYSGRQIGIDFGNEIDGYRLTVGDTRGMQVDINIGSESDGYHLGVGGYARDVGRY